MHIQHGAFYIRVSTDDQTEYSPDAQLKALQEYAERNNIAVKQEHIFIDEGFSGRRAEKRPAFQEMIKLAKKKPKPFDMILVHKFDRFARNREDSVVYKSLLRKECGIKVVSITEQLEDDKFSIILESMLEAMAEYYSLNLADEVKKGMIEKAKRGEYQSTPPFGYAIQEKKLKIVPEEAKIIKLIFEKYVYESESFFSIAKLINHMGIRTKRGNRFENRNIEYILNNPIYAGKVRWNPDGKTCDQYKERKLIIVDGQHQPIISWQLYDQAQKKLARHKKFHLPKKRPSQEYAHWLSGIIRCSHCGARLVYSKTHTPSFQCRGYIGGKCNISHSISVDKLEKVILGKIKKDISKTRHLHFELISPSKESSELEILKVQLGKINNKYERAKEAFLAGIDTLDEYENSKSIIHKEEEQLKKRIKALEAQQGKMDLTHIEKESVQNAYEVLTSELTTQEKNTVFSNFVKEIIFDKSNQMLMIEYRLLYQ